MSGFVLLFVLMVLAAPVGAQEGETVVHMLDYIGVDYPGFVRNGTVLNEQEYREQLEFARQVGELLAKLPRAPASAKLSEDAAALRERIEAKAPGEEVSRLANALRWEIIRAYKIAVSPKRAPDLKVGARRYATLCAACHGAQGRGDGSAGISMKPPPADFHDARRMSQRSVYGLYSTISLGVSGTAMPAFAQLPEDERWALAFYIASLGADADKIEKGRVLWERNEGRSTFRDLRQLSTLTDAEVRGRYGENAAAIFAYLKTQPPAVSKGAEGPLDLTRRLLAESLAARRGGDLEGAQRLALAAYLEGYEPAEAALDTVDRSLRMEIEAQMMTYRNVVADSGSIAPVEAHHERLRALLDRAAEKMAATQLSPSAVALSAALIILREGLEAILVLAAILAFAARSGRVAARRYVHAGWIGAVVLGIATWVAASRLIEVSGADRELTEGFTALIASAMLLYVGYWLHDKTHAKAWTTYLSAHAGRALGSGTLWSLAFLAFLAVYRELFEVVLFYEALWAQAGAAGHSALAGGTAAGTAILAIVGLLIFRFGLRLPIGPFFLLCTVLLLVLAVSFAGQGIAKLQAAGLVGVEPIDFVRIPLLGIFPTVQTLSAQAAILAVMAGAFAWSRFRAAREAHP